MSLFPWHPSCLADQLRRRINLVVTSKGNSEDQVGGNKRQPKFYPVSGPSLIASSASQKRADQPANRRHDWRAHHPNEDFRPQRLFGHHCCRITVPVLVNSPEKRQIQAKLPAGTRQLVLDIAVARGVDEDGGRGARLRDALSASSL